MKWPCYVPVGEGMLYMVNKDGSAKLLKVGLGLDGSPVWIVDVLHQPRSFIVEALRYVLEHHDTDFTVLPEPKFPPALERRQEAGS